MVHFPLLSAVLPARKATGVIVKLSSRLASISFNPAASRTDTRHFSRPVDRFLFSRLVNTHTVSLLSRLFPPRLFLLFLYVSIEFGAVAPATRDFLRFFFFYRRQFRRLLSSYLIFFNRIFICKAPVSNNRKNRKFPLGIKTEYNEPSLSS